MFASSKPGLNDPKVRFGVELNELIEKYKVPGLNAMDLLAVLSLQIFVFQHELHRDILAKLESQDEQGNAGA